MKMLHSHYVTFLSRKQVEHARADVELLKYQNYVTALGKW